MSAKLPARILFVCTHNMVRSPMAEGLMRARLGDAVVVASCGVHPGVMDGFTLRVMEEVGIDVRDHTPQDLASLAGGEAFDLVVSFSDESRAAVEEFAGKTGCAAEHWPVHDPAVSAENQQARLEAYRNVRDMIAGMIEKRFG